MRAIVQDRYGDPDQVLQLQELPAPLITDDQVLVRVHAASLHLGDLILMRGVPRMMRMATGLRRPKQRVPGTDLAGVVEAVGSAVTGFAVGDAVFGWAHGAFAELAAVPATQLVHKPERLTFEEAAAVGVSATTALQLLRDDGRVRPGMSVLINGASGGVGTFAVQVAKALGAEVTGVSSTRNLDLVRSLGADHVIDYTTTDFTAGDRRWDLVLDNAGNHGLARMRRVLTPTGLLISNGGGHHGGAMGTVLRAMLTSLVNRQQARPSVKFQNRADLLALAALVDAGSIRPVIDTTRPLPETSAALDQLGTGRARGTLVIGMAG